MEVNVTGYDRWQASAEVYRKLGLTGANDSRIKHFVMTEEKEATPVKKNKNKRDSYKRYRVTVFLSPASKNPVVRNLQTSSSQQALWAVLGMYAITTTDRLGPYRVEEELSPDVWVTRKVKDAHTFSGVNLIPEEDPVSSVAMDVTKAVFEEVEDKVLTTEEWDAEWEAAWQAHLYGQPHTKSRRSLFETDKKTQEEVLSKIGDLFKSEKKAEVPKINIVRK